MQYLLGNGLIQEVSQTIDIYVLKWALVRAIMPLVRRQEYSRYRKYILIVIANRMAKRSGQERLF